MAFVIGILALDQATKKWAQKNIAQGMEVEIVKGKLAVTHVKNKGAAFGLFAKNKRTLWLTTIVALVHLAGEMMTAMQRGDVDAGDKIGWACMTGGAVGNLIDRAKDGEVTDFIHIKTLPKMPIFNIADVFVLIGVIMFIRRNFFKFNR
jgi:signal peptidase II